MSEDRLEHLFHQLVELPADTRRERLEALRAREPSLHRELIGLLAAFEEAPGFLEPAGETSAPPETASDGVPADRAHARGASRRLGKYAIEREIGRGGMGIVHLAHDPDLERPVAVKVLSHGGLSRDRVARLRREARALASINHPHVAQVYSIEEVETAAGEATAVLTMEYIPGTSLAGRLREGPILPLQALDFGRQIAAALEAAHGCRIVHRDLKPHNVRVTPDGWVKVLDFGLALVLAPQGDAEPSRARSTGGTPGYMSPEQCRGEPIDHRSDLWSFGAVLYECLTGEPAVQGAYLADLMDANRSGAVSLRALPPSVPPSIGDLLRTCLEADPVRRSTSAASARRILEEELLRLRAAALLGVPAHPVAQEAPSRGNLPRPWSSFVGRVEQLRQMESALAESRLVTVTGPGGVGKTRASQELARRMESAFPGGIWFIDLSAISDGPDVPATVARTLREGGALPSGPSQGTHRAMIDSFRGERGLILLDNCEHVSEDAARFVQELLAIPSGVSVLATSRQSLGLAGERIVPLPPLDLPPDLEQVGQLETLEATDAIRLFLDRARSRNAGLSGEGAERDLIGRICRRLDGLPLALELAASHAGSFSLEELARLIEAGRPLSALGGALPDRHRSLNNLVDWSFALLSPAERTLLERLSIFRGGCTLLAAESVCGGWGGIEGWEVYALVARLVERSLVVPEPGPRGDGEPDPAAQRATRYRLLETIRVYAEDRLREDPAAVETLTTRYLVHLRSIAALREEEKTPLRSSWTRRIAPDYTNLLHGLDLALSGGRLGLAFALTEPLGATWVQTGQWLDGTRWMDRILAARSKGGGIAPEHRAAEVHVLSLAGLLQAIQGHAERARPILEEALACAEALGEAEPLAQALEAAGVAAWRAGRLDEAQGHIERCLRCFEEAGDPGGVAVATGNLGILDCTRGRLESARALFEKYLRLARGMNDALAAAAALGNLGWIAGSQGRTDEARSCLEEAVEIQRRNRDLPAAAMMLQNLGEILIKDGSTEEARLRLRESSRIRRRIGDRHGLMTNVIVFGRLAEREERRAEAAELLAGAMRLVERGEFECRPDVLEALRRSRAELAERLSEEEMDRAARRAEARDLWSLLAIADPEAFGPGATDSGGAP